MYFCQFVVTCNVVERPQDKLVPGITFMIAAINSHSFSRLSLFIVLKLDV